MNILHNATHAVYVRPLSFLQGDGGKAGEKGLLGAPGLRVSYTVFL